MATMKLLACMPILALVAAMPKVSLSRRTEITHGEADVREGELLNGKHVHDKLYHLDKLQQNIYCFDPCLY